MRFHTLKRIFEEYVDELYPLPKGIHITEPNKEFLSRDVRITRRQIKHIVEQRKAEGKSAEEIKQLLAGVLEMTQRYDFEIPNANQGDYPESVMRVTLFSSLEKGIIVILDRSVGTTRDLISAFFCRPERVYLLKKKKPQEPASGETPHP